MDEIMRQLVDILDALDGKPTVANQGQAMDGYSALANFRAVAEKARTLIEETP